MGTGNLKVLIFGFGNLGQSLFRVCKDRFYPAIVISRRFEKPHCSTPVFTDEYEADLIINTVGGNFWDNFETLWRLNITDNKSFLELYPNRPYIVFSSQLSSEPWRSPYAATKNALESLTGHYENLFVIRLSTRLPHEEFDVEKLFEITLDFQIRTI